MRLSPHLLFVVVGICCLSATALEEKRDNKHEKLFFAGLSTLSHTIVSYTTSTVILSCMHKTAAAKVCLGKKKRKRRETNSPIKFDVG